ncbi:MAG: AEC family transporter [Polaromonas sp.]|uniref:AEC family transporter n=1 Tax=Polaromonas sp. TaxID=1869339 RepID=UPI002736ADF7|nr:AEC family transporter [Polaromonas sp.]MDP3796527.1 AEC family transporter [Polaromonas sp.]
MNPPVFVSLVPVVLLIAAGFIAGHAGWIRPQAIKDLSNLIFLLLTPALLFRTMSRVRVEQLDFKPVAAYFLAVIILFGGTLLVQGFNRRAAVLALANTFSNTVMIGIALVGLMYGPAGLVTLLTLVSVHSLVLLTSATVVLELAVAYEQKQGTSDEVTTAPRHPVVTVLMAVKNSLLHPVPLPIIAGLLFAQTGLVIPAVIDKPLELLANAFGPLALVLVGVTLANTPVGRHWRQALLLSGVKNLLHPLLVFGLCRLLGVGGVPMAVMVVAAALPIGANVFLFSQRYKVAEELTTASVAVSTVLALLTLTLVLLLVGQPV